MKPNSRFALACVVILLLALCVFASGCAHRPATPQLELAGAPGYRLTEVTRPGQSDDLLVVLDYNLDHPQPGAGSAIFFHLAAPDFGPTAGCVAVTEQAMRRILARSDQRTVIDIR